MDTVKVRTKFTEMSKIFKDIVDEYESLKNQIEKQNEAYSLMCAEKTRRYNELLIKYQKLQAKERYNIMDNKGKF